jgi:hypothetical protein
MAKRHRAQLSLKVLIRVEVPPHRTYYFGRRFHFMFSGVASEGSFVPPAYLPHMHSDRSPFMARPTPVRRHE